LVPGIGLGNFPLFRGALRLTISFRLRKSLLLRGLQIVRHDADLEIQISRDLLPFWRPPFSESTSGH